MRTRETLTAAGTACLLTVIMTWPLVAQFGSSGRVDSGDGRFSIWAVSWVAHALTTSPGRVFDANIFYPHTGTLAFSEANLVAGALAIPAWVATKNPHAASNFVIFVSFVLSSLTMYALVRRLGGGRIGSAIAALSFAFCPFVLAHVPHVQLLMTFTLPLVLLAMHGFASAPSLKTSTWMGGAIALAGLACAYYGVFGGLAACWGVVWFGVAGGRWRDWRYWALAAAGAIVAILIVTPFFTPFAEVRAAGFERSLEAARIHSVGWRSYFASPIAFHRWMLPVIGTWRDVLFPGFLPLLFAMVAVGILVKRRCVRDDGAPRAVLAFYVSLGALAVWASLGPDAGLYGFFHRTIPVFGMLQAPARFGLLVTMSVCVLAGLGFTAIEFDRSGRRRRAVLTAAACLAVARSTIGLLPLVPAPATPVAHRRLATLPDGPVAEFPFFTEAHDRHRHTEYMLISTGHWKPLVNGYSDFLPARSSDAGTKLATFPSDEAWDVIRSLGVRYVLVHWRLYEGHESDRIRNAVFSARRLVHPILDAPDVSLYQVIASRD